MRRGWTMLVALVCSTLPLASCALGERPSFDDSPTAVGTDTGDPAIDTVLDLLDSVGGSMFTATYDATLLFGGRQTEATVAQIGPRRSVTIGNIRFLTEGGSSRTCVLDTGVCTEEIQAAAVSDTGLTPEFASGDMAKRLRRDAVAKVGPSTQSIVQIGGVEATCVDVTVTGGTKQYCVLPDGVIARFRGADITLELRTHTSAADEGLFTP